MKEKLLRIVEETNNNTVFKALGIQIDKLDADESIVSMAIDHRHRQHVGLVHGGIYVLLSESAASMAGACAVDDDSMVVGLEINANHIRSTVDGKLFATSKSIHRGKTTMVYEVKVTDEEKRLISISRCTLMVIKPK